MFEMPELHPQDRALETFHPVVISAQQVMIFPVCAPIPQHANFVRVLGVVRRNGAAFAVGSEILGGIKAETTNMADASGGSPLVLGPVSLRCVFDYHKAVPLGYFH